MKEGKETYRLVVREDEYIGEIGWCVEQLVEMFDQPSVALRPNLIAHDIIEHVNGIDQIGGIGEELQAMGGLWNTRGQWGVLDRDSYSPYSAEQSVGYEICELGRRFLCGEELGCYVPDVDTSEWDYVLKDIWYFAKKALRSELEHDEWFADSYLEYKLSLIHI